MTLGASVATVVADLYDTTRDYDDIYPFDVQTVGTMTAAN